LLKFVQLLISKILNPICRAEWFECGSVTGHVMFSLI
jgi:hypothetical protein